MSTTLKRIGISAACVVMLVALAPAAHAFFPLGFTDADEVIHYLTWDKGDFDTNNDGFVTVGEGLDIVLLGGALGFSEDQIQEVLDAFKVWDGVPTSYASFNLDGVTEDPIQGSDAIPDFITLIAWDIDGSDTGGGVIGLTTTLFLQADGYVDIGNGQQVYFSAGDIIDSDIELDPLSLQPQPLPGGGTAPALADFKSTLVHELGHMLGLAHTPLNNVREDPVTLSLVESEVMWITDASGIPRLVGVTPTMYPIVFNTQEESGSLFDGGVDLAPDDISGISWLYPDGSQSRFFGVSSTARTQSRTGAGVPSSPIPGGHVVVWADVDNNPGTARVPVFSTMTGLYEKVSEPATRGRFRMMNLWKQMEVPGTSGALFNPTYTFTLNPFNETGYDRQTPPGLTVDQFDGLHTGATYDIDFPSEVFHETSNVNDISNKDAGTPMVWTSLEGALISADTGRTVNAILDFRRPMFGDPNNVCPLNVIQTKSADSMGVGSTGSLLSQRGPASLRAFRDRFLLESTLGTALVDQYYKAAPALAGFLLKHTALGEGFRCAAHGFYWLLEHKMMIGILVLSVLALASPLRKRGKARARLTALLLIALCFGLCGGAQARILHFTTEQLGVGAEYLYGTVVSAEGRWTENGKIHTDVVLEVSEAIKGNYNKGAMVTFSVPGGQVGNVAMDASEMPKFRKDQEVIIWLVTKDNGEKTVRAGLRGVVNIATSADGKKFVFGASDYAQAALAEDSKAMEDGEDPAAAGNAVTYPDASAKIPLEDYLAYLRAMAKEQKRKGE